MTGQAQKDEERFYLEKFLGLLPEKTRVVDADRELKQSAVMIKVY
ncbi:hypothetical protein P4B35_05785 [Pontiellaceae bacterium B12227]|nr:hypothetical protein [Pontiellaceae bacterium B12227]